MWNRPAQSLIYTTLLLFLLTSCGGDSSPSSTSPNPTIVAGAERESISSNDSQQAPNETTTTQTDTTEVSTSSDTTAGYERDSSTYVKSNNDDSYDYGSDAPKKTNRDAIFGIFPCSGSGSSNFTSPFYPIDLITGIRPMGKMQSSHVTPTDHLYIERSPNPDKSQDTEYVVAPADGVIVKISRFPEDNTYLLGVATPEKVPDYRVIVMHSCTFFTIFIHLGELAPSIAEATGEITHGNTWFGTGSSPIPVKIGDPIAKFGGQTLDWSVHNSDITLRGFVIPEHYESEPWKIHTVDPFPFYEEPLRSALISKVMRTVEPIAGKIDYDIEGTIAGNWFLDGTVDYSGSVASGAPRYWNGHLSIAYGYIEASQIRISIGLDMVVDTNNDCKVCFGAYGVKGNSPDPATVSTETGLVRYELMSRERGEESGQAKLSIHEMVGDKSLGTLLVEHLGDRAIRVEILPGKTPDEVEGFTDAALIYRR